LGAPSHNTTSAEAVWSWALMCDFVFSVVMSPMRVMTLGIPRMGSMSTARRMVPPPLVDMVREATWVHPPGAAQRSITILAFSRK